MDAIVKALGRIESLLARSVNPAPKHGAGIPPWQMWGTSEVVTAQADTIFTTIGPTTQQLAQIIYKRPETWHWFFAAELLEAKDSPPGQGALVDCKFEISFGVGRDTITIPDFERLAFTWGTLSTPSDLAPTVQRGSLGYLYSVAAIARNRIQNAVAGLTFENLITQIVAQNIQVRCNVKYNVSPAFGADTAKVRISSFFSPKVHVRPEWALHAFPGGEEK